MRVNLLFEEAENALAVSGRLVVIVIKQVPRLYEYEVTRWPTNKAPAGHVGILWRSKYNQVNLSTIFQLNRVSFITAVADGHLEDSF